MKLALASLLLLGVVPALAQSQTLAAIDWSQPKIGCIEEMVPQLPTAYPCLDLSKVDDPTTDFPEGMSADDRKLWNGERKLALRMCRAQEIMKREEAHPGSMPSGSVEIAYMRVLSLRDTEAKVDAIYSAADEQGMPPHVLLGALMQESLMADLGIAEDGGNFSCGIAQLNIGEFCRWAEALPEPAQRGFGWPLDVVAAWKKAHPGKNICEAPIVSPELVRPYHELGLKRLGGLPAYRLGPEHLKGITLDEVAKRFPAASADTQQLRHAIISSFTQACSNFRQAIPAKARELRAIYDRSVPAPLKRLETYPTGKRFERACRHEPQTRQYPLHTGWLIADSIYNAGSNVISAITYYEGLDHSSVGKAESWRSFHPTSLVEALYWSGQYDAENDRMVFADLDGNPRSFPWLRSCIGQRHIARVIQHVTLPGRDFVSSLEPNGCSAHSAPEERQRSSGRREGLF